MPAGTHSRWVRPWRPGARKGSPTHIPELEKELREPFPGRHSGGWG